ncbi:MAG: ROK family protein [Methylotenera sp.]|nr:ROK family protein [Methylotenera sp.]
MALLIGIDVGGTNLRLGVVEWVNGQAKLLEEMRFQADFSSFCKMHQHAPQHAWQIILITMASAIQSVRAQHPSISAVGIGFPGFIDPTTQQISQSPNLPGLKDVDLSADLSAMIGLPVTTENDALAAAYGEAFQLKLDNLIYLGLGTGVGGGLVLNGKPFQGQHGVAMEVGHIITTQNGRLCGCGNHGCMEQYASASGVAKTYVEHTHQQCTAAEISLLAQAGDEAAIKAYSLAGASLAQALAHILKVIDVPNVVIGGGMSAGWLLMKPTFDAQLQQDLIPALRGKIHIHLSQMGDQAGIIGAAMLATIHRKEVFLHD